MKLLLINDDGYKATGIGVLEECLTDAGYEVWVCAPESQRSATSHAIHLREGVRIYRVSERHYVCTGYPADCVLYACGGAIPCGSVDAVISGINEGYNLSSDLLYSATAGGASEASFRGMKAVAISCGHDENGVFCYEEASLFLVRHLKDFLPLCTKHTYININVPPHACGWGVSSIGAIDYGDKVFPGSDDESYTIAAEVFHRSIESACNDTDWHLVYRKNLISVASLCVLPSTKAENQTALSELLKKESV